MTEPYYPLTCSKSAFKDDRHDWETVMAESYLSCSSIKWDYVLRRCKACKLLVLVYAHPESNPYGEITKKDQIVHAFYEVPKEAKP